MMSSLLFQKDLQLYGSHGFGILATSKFDWFDFSKYDFSFLLMCNMKRKRGFLKYIKSHVNTHCL